MFDVAVRSRYETPQGFASHIFINDLLAQPAFRRWKLPEEELRAALLEQPYDYADAVRRVFALYARRQGKPRYGDKTAVHVLSIAVLARLFPEARFVHIIRDGRDVALSWLDTGWDFGPETVEEAALYWRYHVGRGRRAGQQLGHSRYTEVTYERLIANPASTIEELCHFLSLEFHTDMLTPPTADSAVMAEIPRPKQHQNLLLPMTAGLRDWRRQMSAEDVRTFEGIAGPQLHELGYEIGGLPHH